jgi:hypothetical protein
MNKTFHETMRMELYVAVFTCTVCELNVTPQSMHDTGAPQLHI